MDTYTESGFTYCVSCDYLADDCPCHETRHMADGQSTDTPAQFHTPRVAPVPGQAPSTPLAEVRTRVERVRREMAAEREAAATLRRVRNEDARVFEYLRRVPVTNGYTEALARQRGSAPELDIYQHGPVPCPCTLALGGEIVQRRADGTPVRLPEGGDPPDGYALALEARRSTDRQQSDK